MLDYRSPLERLYNKLGAMIKADALPLISGLLFGLLAHMFVITNKLMNADEIAAIYSKGATIDSGRWALEALRYVFPDLSLPWLWGLMTIVLITIASCLTLRIFEVKHKFHRWLLPALFVTFPSLTGTMCFMFTSNSYGLAFFLAVFSVWAFVKLENRPIAWLLSCACLAFSIGVYQAYIAISASFFVLLMVQRLLEKEDERKVFAFGLSCVAMLVLSLVVYYGINILVVKLCGGNILGYAFEEERGFLHRIALAYNALYRSLFSGYFGFINSKVSMFAHFVALGICAVLMLRELAQLKEIKKVLLLLLCVAVLPLSMNCLFLISSAEIIHSLVLYSFVALYVFAVILLERVDTVKLCNARDVVVLCMLAVVVCNTFFANKVYLKMHIQYENAFAFYTTVLSDIYDSPDYDKEKKLLLIGNYADTPKYEHFDVNDFFGPSENLINSYTKSYFFVNYIGYAGPLYDGYEWEIENDPRIVEMPAYPEAGSIKCIDDLLVVKLG